jgi:hypothetical protein
MDGLSSSTTAYHNVLWADAELLGIVANYENLSLTLRESTGQVRRIVCEGYLGYEALGVWDEVVVAHARLSAEGSFLTRCIASIERRLGPTRLPSGSEARNGSTTMELTIVLSDGCEVRVAMKGLHIEFPAADLLQPEQSSPPASK